MNTCVEVFKKKINALKKYIFNGDSSEAILAYQNEKCADIVAIDRPKKYSVFISVCNGEERATVFRAAETTLENAWNTVVKSASSAINKTSLDPMWVKVDIMNTSWKETLDSVTEMVRKGRNEFFRHGISFNLDYESSVIEAEINGSRLIYYKKDENFDFVHINNYLATNKVKTILEKPEEVILFDCLGYFCDNDDNVYGLYNSGLNCGRRIVEKVDKDVAYGVIKTSSEYLADQVFPHGEFTYGYFPVFDKSIPNYNIRRHTMTISSLIRGYKLTGNKKLLRRANLAVDYVLKHVCYKSGTTDVAFLIDRHTREIELGGNSVAVIMLLQYMELLDTDKYLQVAIHLSNGILEMRDSKTGEFWHVLNSSGFSKKDKQRLTSYDGQAAFALSRIYSMTKDVKYLKAAESIVNRFADEDYAKDCWIANAMTEITLHLPKNKYFNYVLKNVQNNLDTVNNQEITYHTHLEMLTASFEIYQRLKETGYNSTSMAELDVVKFVKTIFHRAHYMLNGYSYPEFVMYLQAPGKILGSFYMRHEGFRMRIDDVHRFCNAYLSFYDHYDALDELVKSLNIDISE